VVDEECIPKTSKKIQRRKFMKHFLVLFCAFFTILTLSWKSVDASVAYSPQMAMDMNGNGVIVWQELTSNGPAILANILYQGVWAGAQTLSTNYTGSKPMLGVTANGSDLYAVVVWVQNNSGSNSLFAAMLPTMTSSPPWTSASQISGGGDNVGSNYSVQINSAGNILANWSSYDTNSNIFLFSATALINSSNTWNSPTQLN
jgi:hypothetical protein